jgi:hypothetical protein
MRHIYKVWEWVLGCLLALGLQGCGGHRATTAEAVLFGHGESEKYWLFNQILTDLDGGTQHYSLLVTQSPTAAGQATAFFVARYDSRDASYHYGMGIDPAGQWSKPDRWPWIARMATQRGDSVTADWRLYWNRKALWLDGYLNGGEGNAFTLRGHYPTKQALAPFQMYPVPLQDSVLQGRVMGPSVHVLTGMAGKLGVGAAPPRDGFLQAAVFDDMGTLLLARDAKAIYWLQMRQADGREDAYLLRLDAADRLTALSHFATDPLHPWYNAGMDESDRWATTDAWTSPHSHKTYRLGIQVSTPLYTHWIRPKKQVQEVQAGNKSFWMGAVDISTPATAAPFATGNMYIFTH